MDPRATVPGGTGQRTGKILIVDPLHPAAVRELDERFEVVMRHRPSEAELRTAIRDVDVLVMRSGVRLTGSVIAAAERLKLVARAGVGVDNIDIPAAQNAGIRVFNVPAQSSNSVAEFTFGLVLAVTRRIPLACAQVKRNEWRKSELVGQDLRNSTIGIVGLGAIGSVVAELACAFGMQVLATVGTPTSQRRRQLDGEGIELIGLSQLLAQAKVVCVAAPLNESTRDLIAAEELGLMINGSYLVNVSRGGVVNENDLYQALENGKLAGAALDVVAAEGQRNRLADLDNVVLTPHIGAMTEQAQERIGEIVVRSIIRGLNGERVANELC